MTKNLSSFIILFSIFYFMKKVIVVILVIALLFALGCTSSLGNNTTDTNSGGDVLVDNNTTQSNQFSNLDNFRKVKTGDSVSVHYTLSDENREVESNVGKAPYTFIVGSKNTIKGFSDGVIGMEVWDKKTIVVPPENAYGKVQFISINNFADPTQVIVGSVFNNDNEVTEVKVFSVDGNVVGITPNHPQAGKTLIFDLELVSIN